MHPAPPAASQRQQACAALAAAPPHALVKFALRVQRARVLQKQVVAQLKRQVAGGWAVQGRAGDGEAQRGQAPGARRVAAQPRLLPCRRRSAHLVHDGRGRGPVAARDPRPALHALLAPQVPQPQERALARRQHVHAAGGGQTGGARWAAQDASGAHPAACVPACLDPVAPCTSTPSPAPRPARRAPRTPKPPLTDTCTALSARRACAAPRLRRRHSR